MNRKWQDFQLVRKIQKKNSLDFIHINKITCTKKNKAPHSQNILPFSDMYNVIRNA